MRRNRTTMSASLGFALCLTAGSAAYADQSDTESPAAADSSAVTVEVVELPVVEDGVTGGTAAAEPPAGEPDGSVSSPAPPADPAPEDPLPEDPLPIDGSQGTAADEPVTSEIESTSQSAAEEQSSQQPAPSAGDPAEPQIEAPLADAQPTVPEPTSGTAAADPAAQAPAAEAVTVQSAGQTVSTVADGLTPEQVVESLVGEGIVVSNVTYTGHGTSVGIAAGMGAIGIADGIVLSSGSVQVTETDDGGLVGPNEDDGYGVGFGNPGDSDLSDLAQASTYDAAVLEFDFVPSGDQLVFHYVFASEEYNEYVGSYNDVFAFYVNGVNCATVDGAPVSVNNINSNVNSDQYVNNDLDDVGSPAPHDTEMDGFTTVLTCSASVNAGAVNHIKLAIADASDSILDSLVIIQQGSFSSQPPPVAVDDAYSTPIGETLVIVVPGLMGNDTQSPGGGTPTAVKITDPANGTVTINPDGSFTYTPSPGFSGTDTFTYLVTDAWGNSNIATVTINVQTGEVTPVVTPVDTPPGSAVLTPVSGDGSVPAGSPGTVYVTTGSPGPAASDGALASTGIEIAPMGAISVTLIGTGIAMYAAGRRRSSN